eukprot:CAMPEP_0184872194 /NCGR_PEP_ID=MMETSP0580-20130426/41146_1 /TAXON_ID=1118495 /ORGANISM="Dactyliosolen fragilissimus" /LENGTH=880 /DNA_ID=CAMNT_0027374951 /DNA_START=855 /DNA_END=3498 /DNA_ORIENTATION=+
MAFSINTHMRKKARTVPMNTHSVGPSSTIMPTLLPSLPSSSSSTTTTSLSLSSSSSPSVLSNFGRSGGLPSQSLSSSKKKENSKLMEPMPVVGYNAEEICNYYDRSPLVVGWRLNSLSLPLLGWYIRLLTDKLLTGDKPSSPAVQRKRGKELRQILVKSKSVALIKSAQALSLRPDLLRNKIWAEELGKLVDAVGSFNDWDAMTIIQKELSDLLPRIKAADVTNSSSSKKNPNTKVNNNQKKIQTSSSTKYSSRLSRLEKRVKSDPYFPSLPRIKAADVTNNGSNKNSNRKDNNQKKIQTSSSTKYSSRLSRLEKRVKSDPVLSIFEFYNSCHPVASASIGQVYKARIKRGPYLEAAIGKLAAKRWGGKTVAIKVQRPDAAAAASLDMYLIRRTAMWASKFRGGDLCGIADTFGEQLFGELDYIREANNCHRFKYLYGSSVGDDDDDNSKNSNRVDVPQACDELTRRKVLVMEWIDGEKGPWKGKEGIEMVSTGLQCSVDQLLNTGLFHADPHRGNLLRTRNGNLAFIDFGMMADVTEDERYGLIGLAVALQNKDLSLITENLLKLGFLEDTTQLDILIPRLRQAAKNATGGTGKASDINFSRLQAELDAISRENVVKFKTPAFFTVIIRSLTILEGFALDVDPNFRLVRGAYPYVLKQLLSPDGASETPEALKKLLIRLLTVNGEEKEIEWERLRDFLRLAQRASRNYDPSQNDDTDTDNKTVLSRNTIDLFFRFMTSKTGLFLKKPLVHELSETIDGMASLGEANLLRISRGIIRPLPGGNGPVNRRRMQELSQFVETLQSALVLDGDDISQAGRARVESLLAILREMVAIVSDEKRRDEAMPILQEVISVFQLVAVEVLEIRGSRAMRNILQLSPSN